MGALTLKTFSDELREWEFIEGEGVDPTDCFGADLRLSIRENQIFLAEPSNPDTPWLTDRGRLFFDGMFDAGLNSSPVHWRSFFKRIFESVYCTDHLNLKQNVPRQMFFVFENISVEVAHMLYLLQQKYSFVELRKAEGGSYLNDKESQYQLNDGLKKSKLAMSSLALLLSVDTRHEGYILNLSLRQRWLKGNFKVFSIGPSTDLTFPTYSLGSTSNSAYLVAEGTHSICQDIQNADFPLLVGNSELSKREDLKNVTRLFRATPFLQNAWYGINTLSSSLSETGILSLANFKTLDEKDLQNYSSLYFLNSSIDAISNLSKITDLNLLGLKHTKQANKTASLMIEQNSVQTNEIGSPKTFGADKLYFIPSSPFTEANETYLNTEGTTKRVTKLVSFNKETKTNWQILRKIYYQLKDIDFLSNLKTRSLIEFDCVSVFNFKNYCSFQYQPTEHLTSLSSSLTKSTKPYNVFKKNSLKINRVKIKNTKLKYWLDDFFTGAQKNFYSRRSVVLSNCSQISRANTANFF